MRFSSAPSHVAFRTSPVARRGEVQRVFVCLQVSVLLLVGLFGVLLCGKSRAQESSHTQVQGIHDQFVLSLAYDNRGRVWIGTEDQGIWRLDRDNPAVPQWKQYTRQDGLGDERIYALVCDRQNRIWAGHLNHGVSVFNGEQWRNYDVGQGPLGEHVFDLAISPLNGDVWMATNSGLTRYAVAADSWTQYTRLDGLPETALQSLAFNAAGDVIAGTQTHGLVIARAATGYGKWKRIYGPQHLPSDLINDVMVTRQNQIYVATAGGIARSDDNGHTWRSLRDSATSDNAVMEKSSDKSALTAKTQIAAKQNTVALDAPLLRENYVTCLAQDGNDHVWIGYRRLGYEVRGRQRLQVLLHNNGEQQQGFVRAILPLPGNAPPLVGFYGEGHGLAIQQFATIAEPLPAVPSIADLPSPAQPPTLAQLNALLQQVSRVTPWEKSQSATRPVATVLDDDWTTQGDWLGRYGRYQAILGAMVSPNDLIWGAGENMTPYHVRIDNSKAPGDSLRYWVHWLFTATPESLELPPTFYHARIALGDADVTGRRRQSEWDDHGEEYPMSLDGPNVYASLRVPAGWFVMSLYDFNKDGHTGNNRWRDYRVSVRAHPNNLRLDSIKGFAGWPELASGRIRDFRGGVWKRFLVRGPQDFTVEVQRNHSFNTVLSGVFLDRLDEKPAPYFGSLESWRQRQEWREQQGRSILTSWEGKQWSEARRKYFAPCQTAELASQRLWTALQEAALINPVWYGAKHVATTSI